MKREKMNIYLAGNNNKETQSLEIYFSFKMYGERWCVHRNRVFTRFFVLSHWKTGVSVGTSSYYRVKIAVETGKEMLKRAGKKKVLKLLKKFTIINNYKAR